MSDGMQAGSPDLAPVFVVGTTRSGTSVVQFALLNCGRYCGDGEGHLLPLLNELVAGTERFWARSENAIRAGTSVARVDKSAVLEPIYALVRRTYADLFGDAAFAEKTPTIEAIRAVRWLARVWPQAKVIYCRRRGIENVMSKRRKFPAEAFDKLCAEWNGCMLQWLRVRKEVQGYCEIDQMEIARAPLMTAGRIGETLDLSEVEIGRIARFFRDEWPERSNTALEPVRFEDVPWSVGEKALFKQLCDPAMQAYGYRYDESYSAASLPSDPRPALLPDAGETEEEIANR